MRLNTMFITAVCVIFLIKLRWPKNKSLYDYSNQRCINNVNEKCELILEKEKNLCGGLISNNPKALFTRREGYLASGLP